MAEVMVPRGPDAAGVWSQGRVALGHRRLKIIDLSEAGAQPMVDAELGLSVAWNGCIYNYEQLRDELSGHGYRFFSHSDTEVLLKGYHHWGDRFVDHLKGMFAFAIVEHESGRVLLGRDRLGIKPLYLTQTPDRIRFGSSLPALLAGGDVDTRIDPIALHHYMTFHSVVPSPRTILRGVSKLPPASLMAIEPDGKVVTTTYWEPDFTRRADRADWSEKDWEDAVLESLRTAVKRRLVADVPVGCLLSGGVDSSLIVGLLAEAGQHGLATFSIGFESVGGVKGDEFKYSDIIAERFGTDHHQIRIGTERMLPALDGAIGAMSEPMVSHDCVAFYLLSQEVAKHVKVVQSGQGADEVFAGYHWYPPMGEPAAASVEGSVASYRRAFFDRDRAGYTDLVAPGYLTDGDPSELFVTEHFARAGAQNECPTQLRARRGERPRGPARPARQPLQVFDDDVTEHWLQHLLQCLRQLSAHRAPLLFAQALIAPLCSSRKRSSRPEPEQSLRHPSHLDLLGPLGDPVSTVVPINVLERFVSAVADAAEDLHGTVGGLADQSVGAVVGHRDLVGHLHVVAVVQFGCGEADQQPDHLCLGLQFDEGPLHGLIDR